MTVEGQKKKREGRGEWKTDRSWEKEMQESD